MFVPITTFFNLLFFEKALSAIETTENLIPLNTTLFEMVSFFILVDLTPLTLTVPFFPFTVST